MALLLVLLIVSGLGPGMLLSRRLHLSPLPRLCTALGLSWIIIYLFSTAIYLAGISWQWCYLASFFFLIAFALAWPDIWRMFRTHAVRRAAVGLIILFVWLLLLLALIRTYSGGLWAGDWLEHYDRTQFFLHRGLYYHLFIGIYLLPARPPMMNLVTAFFLAQVGKGFEAFEMCFAVLNLLAFLPAALLLNHLAPRGRRAFWLLVAALASSPFFAENITYTWTKLFCAFYVLLGIALYLRRHPILAFLMLASACLVHYSACPFALFVALHYLWQSIRTRIRPREILKIFFLSGGLLLTWFSWAIWRYGLNETIASTTTFSDSEKLSFWSNLHKIASNIFFALIPPPCGRMYLFRFDQATIGLLRDIAFVCYQQNVLLMMGSAGCVVAVWTFCRGLRAADPRRWFWIGLIGFCVPVAIATHGAVEPYGNAHVVLQPMALIGIAAIAAWAKKLPRWALRWLMLGWAIDFSLGIWLQVYLENFTFQKLMAPNGNEYLTMPIKLTLVAAQSFHGKQQFALNFIGDHWSDYSNIILAILAAGELVGLWCLFQISKRRIYGASRGKRRAVAMKLS